jgi:hypothetical protein
MTHPYSTLPPSRYWRRSVAGLPKEAVDPVVCGKFHIARTDLVATAGSCFAQHIARHLGRAGFTPLVTETVHPVCTHRAEGYNYGVYTARYGNLYTSLQLLQLLKRAYGDFTPLDDVWPMDDGSYVDPFRPQIQPGGFASLAELHADRRQHFAAVRRAIETLDVLVFTLGLTEAWISAADGAVYPLCPGVAGGAFDPDQHKFVNFRAAEIVAHLSEAFAFVRARNPGARFILTVSPVPLIATMEPRSVLVSTAYSKAALRVAAEEVAAADAATAYFPSYEIITGAHSKGSYFADDLRSVTEAGVEHVMRLFFRHYTLPDSAAPAPPDEAAPAEPSRHLAAMQQIVDVICEEENLDRVEAH